MGLGAESLGAEIAGFGVGRAGLGADRAGLGVERVGLGVGRAGLGAETAGLGVETAGLGETSSSLGEETAVVEVATAGVGFETVAGLGTEVAEPEPRLWSETRFCRGKSSSSLICGSESLDSSEQPSSSSTNQIGVFTRLILAKRLYTKDASASRHL